MPSPGAFCSKCGRRVMSTEPRITVRRSRDVYDTGGRLLGRYCTDCWPDPGPVPDQRYRSAAGENRAWQNARGERR